MPMNVALTGSTGHVGTALATLLCERGYSVRAVVHKQTTGLEGLPLTTVEASLEDPESLRRAFARRTDRVPRGGAHLDHPS